MDSPSKINSIRSDVVKSGTFSRVCRVGQQLMATVVDGPAKADTTGKLFIRIANQTLQVRSTMDLRMGDTLKLQVMRVQPQILLSVVALNGVKPFQTIAPLKAATLQLQPSQRGLPELLGVVKALSSDHPRGGLPTPLSPYLRQLINTFVTRHEITDTGALAQAFLNSGLFLESKLLKEDIKALNDRDLKASLLGLLRLLDGQENVCSKAPQRNSGNAAQPPHHNAQPEPQPRAPIENLGSYNDKQIQVLLRELTGAALSRVTLHQIAAVENARESKLRWLTEIPLLFDGEHADVLHLCIERDNHGSHEREQDCWSAELALELPALGPIRARVSLYKGQISTTLWAENIAGIEKLNSELHRLKDALEARSLKVRSLACYAGKPLTSARDDQPPSLLDVQA